MTTDKQRAIRWFVTLHERERAIPSLSTISKARLKETPPGTQTVLLVHDGVENLEDVGIADVPEAVRKAATAEGLRVGSAGEP